MNDEPSDRPPLEGPALDVEEPLHAEEPLHPEDPGPRPWLERIGMAGIAVVMSLLFAALAVAAGSGGEWILAALSAAGALVTIAVGLSTWFAAGVRPRAATWRHGMNDSGVRDAKETVGRDARGELASPPRPEGLREPDRGPQRTIGQTPRRPHALAHARGARCPASNRPETRSSPTSSG